VALGALLVAPATAQGGVAPTVLPGGEYKGETTRGKRVTVKAKDDGVRGVLRFRCAGVRDRFRITEDGRFTAKVRRRGRVIFRARGRFEDLTRVRGSIKRVRGGKRRCSAARFRARLANVDLHKKKVSYGPYVVEPTGGHGSGGGGHNVSMGDVGRPCDDCFLVGFAPDLTENGKSVNFAEQAMLHHIVFFNAADSDATCMGRPERFFASGNERTAGVLPAGYGYRVQPGDTWNTLAHVMNLGDETRTLNVEVTFYYAPADSGLREVRPLWLDVNNCGNSEYSIPAGSSSEVWDFTATSDLEGRIVATFGHVHDQGVQIELRNMTRGEHLCTSRAGYDSDPAYLGHIETMGRCYGDPLGLVTEGDVLRIKSIYDSPGAQHDVMGIVVGYLAPGLGG
jgi:hypothetical protein